MKIDKIMATNMELTDAIRSYVEEKILSLAKLTQNYEPVASCDIEIGKNTEHHNKGKHYKCEVTMQIPGNILRVEEMDEDLYAAIDKVKDELRRQLVRCKGKLDAKQRKGQKLWKKLTSVSFRARQNEE